jgi:hypothetical protein
MGSLLPRPGAQLHQVAYRGGTPDAVELPTDAPPPRPWPGVTPQSVPLELPDPPEMPAVCAPIFAPGLPGDRSDDVLDHGQSMLEQMGDQLVRCPVLQEFVTSTYFDYDHFYCSGTSLLLLGLSLGKSAYLANTAADENFRSWYAGHIRSETTDDISSVVKNFGNGWIMIPVFAGTTLLGPELAGDAGEEIGPWGNRCLRAVVTGGPLVLALQYGLGSNRPGVSPYGSRWTPFVSDHGVSGHAFIGALPFVTAAKMTDSCVLKIALYGLSVLPALSRINDDEHYLSQASLGWSLGYLACAAVDETETRVRTFTISPMALNAGPGLGLIWRI